jgi:4-carboxymuconolactone decarboxylase
MSQWQASAKRESTVQKPTDDADVQIKATLPAFSDYTEHLLFNEVWERPDLSKRDRSLITIAALVAMYRPDELVAHLNLGMDHGLTKEEIAEAVTHLAFYAAWPSANSAMYRFMDVLKARGEIPA